jgi:hypothetical protein
MDVGVGTSEEGERQGEDKRHVGLTCIGWMTSGPAVIGRAD